METLTLEQLAPYLPYSVMAQDINTKEVRLVTLLHFTYNTKTVGHNHLIYNGLLLLSKHLLVLRPLSDLTKKIEQNGETFVPIEKLKEEMPNTPNFDYLLCMGINKYKNLSETNIEWCVIKKLHEWHFDTENLIPRGLAISY